MYATKGYFPLSLSRFLISTDSRTMSISTTALTQFLSERSMRACVTQISSPTRGPRTPCEHRYPPENQSRASSIISRLALHRLQEIRTSIYKTKARRKKKKEIAKEERRHAPDSSARLCLSRPPSSVIEGLHGRPQYLERRGLGCLHLGVDI